MFTFAMIAAGVLASVIAAYEGKTSMIFGGLFVVYLIFTATTTVKPLSWSGRPMELSSARQIPHELRLTEMASARIRSVKRQPSDTKDTRAMFEIIVALWRGEPQKRTEGSNG